MGAPNMSSRTNPKAQINVIF